MGGVRIKKMRKNADFKNYNAERKRGQDSELRKTNWRL